MKERMVTKKTEAENQLNPKTGKEKDTFINKEIAGNESDRQTE